MCSSVIRLVAASLALGCGLSCLSVLALSRLVVSVQSVCVLVPIVRIFDYNVAVSTTFVSSTISRYGCSC